MNSKQRLLVLLVALLLIGGTSWLVATTDNVIAVGPGNAVMTVTESGGVPSAATILYPTTVNGDIIASGGNVNIGSAGNGVVIKEGTNARMGVSTLVGGTVTNANTSVTANTRVFLSSATAGGTQGNLSYTISAGTNFVIKSSSNTDTSTVNWLLIEKQ